jgi:hypothetical protein
VKTPGSRCPRGRTPRTLPSYDDRVPEGRNQAAELLAEFDEDVDAEEGADDVDEVVDDFASDDEPLALDAGLLLDEAPRESLR